MFVTRFGKYQRSSGQSNCPTNVNQNQLWNRLIQRLTKGIQTEFNSLTGDSSTYREVHILESLDLDRIAESNQID